MVGFRNIDHIVFVTSELNSGISFIEELTGAKVHPGGRHLEKGTHNAIMRIGDLIYLEILSLDPSNKENWGNAWLGANVKAENRISAWCTKSSDFQSSLHFMNQLSKYEYACSPGSRKKDNGEILKWELGLCKHKYIIDAFPFFVNWGKSKHPTLDLPKECEIIEFKIKHPCPKKINRSLEHFNVKAKVEHSDTARIGLKLKCPNGVVEIT